MTKTKSKLLASSQGQSLVETALVAMIVTLFIKLLFLSLYLIAVRMWTDYQGYEALICSASYGNSVFVCEKTFEKKIAGFLIFGKLHQVRLSKSQSRVTSLVLLSFPLPGLKAWKIQDGIKLPLRHGK